jgi:hypothetical protein
MSLKRCDSGHHYDPAKHTSCPHCGVPPDVVFSPTRKKEDGQPADKPKGDPAAGKPTVVLGRKAGGVDPVVGWLVCVAGPDRGRDYRLHAEKNFVGRGDDMDVRVAGDETVSRENHAVVSFNPKNNQFKLLPGEGRGLVYLNGEEVDTPKVLKARDTIDLGQTKLMFVPLCGDVFTWKASEES